MVRYSRPTSHGPWVCPYSLPPFPTCNTPPLSAIPADTVERNVPHCTWSTFAHRSTCYLFYGCIFICSSFYYLSMLQLYTIYNLGFVTWYAWRSPWTGQQHKLTRRLASYSTGNPYAVSAWPVYRGQIQSPWRGDVVDSGIGLSYRSNRTASLCSRKTLVRQPYAGVNFFPLVRD